MSTISNSTTESNASDRKIGITLFEKAANAQGKLYTEEVEKIYDWMQNLAPVECKEDLPLIKLSRFRDDYRSDANIMELHGIEGDYDGGELTPSEAVALLEKAGIEAFVYTTPNHTEEKPRFRVLCPLSKAFPAEHHGMLVASLNGVLGGRLAPESFTASQAYYVGSVQGNPSQYFRVSGQCIDLIDGLPSIGKSKTPKNIAPNGSRQNQERAAPTYEVALEALHSRSPGYGDRNWWLMFSGAFYSATRGLADDETILSAWQDWNRSYYNNRPDENQRDWRDFQRNGTNGDFVTLAMMSDCTNARGWALFGGVDYGIRIPSSCTLERKGFHFLRVDQIFYKKQNFLVDRIISENSLSLFFGESGSCKTFGAISLGLSVANGIPWYGHTTRKGAVFYICGEGKAGIQKRIHADAALRGYSLEGLPFYVSSGATNLCDDKNIELIIDLVDKSKETPCLIIVDTLSRNVDGDENDTKEMRTFIAKLDALKDQYGASVLIVHHTGHSENKRARGSSVLKAAMDSEFRFEKSDRDVVTFICTKMKDDEPIASKKFDLRQVPINICGYPENGAALYLNEGSHSAHAVKLSPQNKAAGEILRDYNYQITRESFIDKLTEKGGTMAKKENLNRIVQRIISELKAADALSETFEFLDLTDKVGQKDERPKSLK